MSIFKKLFDINKKPKFPGDAAMIDQLYPSWKTQSADDYAAHNGHRIWEYSMDNYSYDDPALEAWLGRLGQLVRSVDELESCRRRILSESEYLKVQDEIQRERDYWRQQS